MDIKESDILGADIGRHWYYRSKGAGVRRLLGKQHFDCILDIGAGSGYFSRSLLRAGLATSALCVDPNYDSESDESEGARPLRFRRNPDSQNRSDLLLLMDVLEHVDDDGALLRESLAHASPGALVLISVPAFNFMWSGHDEFLGHRRRYTLSELESLAGAEGLQVIKGCYFFGFLLPIAYLTRKFSARAREMTPKSDLRRHHWLVNAILAAICSMELMIMRKNRIGGLTAFCLARAR